MSQAALTQQNSSFRVCVDCVERGGVSGRVYAQRLAAPIAFSGLGSLLLRLDRLMEAQNFPQAYQRARTFLPIFNPECTPGLLPENAMTQEAVDSYSGELCTFCLHVLTRQNATWQGMADWLDAAAPQPFASDIELLHLLEARLSGLE
ncbi:MAG: hypothetical protein EOM68_05115 [Spirochaetia bacterium]|nr:hypothetical protein [Spirochaetia bacterium]